MQPGARLPRKQTLQLETLGTIEFKNLHLSSDSEARRDWDRSVCRRHLGRFSLEVMRSEKADERDWYAAMIVS